MEHGERLPPTDRPPVHTSTFGRHTDKVFIGPLVMDRYMDLVCPAAILIGFLATAPWGRKSWWISDAAATFTFGLGLLIVPQTIMGFQIDGKLDEFHLFIARMIGAVLLGMAASWYLAKDSADQRMFGSLLFARVVGIGCMLVLQLYTHNYLSKRQGIKYNDKHLVFGCLGIFCWWAGSLWQLLRYRDVGGFVHRASFVQGGLLIEHALTLINAVLFLAFPSQFVKIVLNSNVNVDAVHMALLRLLASAVIVVSLSSSVAPGFLYQRDKKAHIYGLLLSGVLFTGLHIYGHFFTGLFSAWHNSALVFATCHCTFLLYLLFSVGKDKEK